MKPLVVTYAEASALTGLGIQKLKNMVKRGELVEVRTIGGVNMFVSLVSIWKWREMSDDDIAYKIIAAFAPD